MEDHMLRVGRNRHASRCCQASTVTGGYERAGGSGVWPCHTTAGRIADGVGACHEAAGAEEENISTV